MRIVQLSLSCLFLCFSGLVGANDVFVQTEYGVVKGRSISAKPGPTAPAKVINTFLGIPFAKAPVGPLRWKAPERPDDYQGIQDATKLGPVCPQDPITLLFTHLGWDKISEDCLHLNVYAPNGTNGPYPVMFWIHGGAYSASGNIQYPGHYLAAMDVVVVVINYRLGSLGFLTTEDSVAPGNYGLLDQHMAMIWAQKNIRNFGGDPDKVTIFGQSAGAGSSGLHIVSPKSKGLFHQAILQSGSDTAPWALNLPSMSPKRFTIDTAKALKCTTETSEKMVECLRGIDVDTLLENEQTYLPPGYITLGFTPTVDKDFIPDVPANLRERGEFSKIRTMIGQTSEDGSFYTLGLIPDLLLRGFNRSEFETELKVWAKQLSPEYPESTFVTTNFEYTNWANSNDLEENRQSFVRMFTDLGFGMGIDKYLQTQSLYNDTYQYVLAEKSTNFSTVIPEWMGVPHNGDLPYTFCYPCNLMPENEEIFKQMDMYPFSIIDWNKEDMEQSQYTMTLWSNFAKYGNPTPNPVHPPNNQKPVTWKMYNEGDTTNYLYIKRDEDMMKENYQTHRHAFWNRFLPNLFKSIPRCPSPSPNTAAPVTKPPNASHRLGFSFLTLTLALYLYVASTSGL